MGSATRDAIAASRAALADASGKIDLALAEELFAAGRIIGGSLQLRTLLGEPAGDPQQKKAALAAVFGSSISARALKVLETVVASRWSSHDDLLAGIEELGLRAVAESATAKVDVEGELFAFGKTVTSNPELELAIGSKLGTPASKAVLVDSLLAGKVSPQALAVVRQLVQQPRGRRIGQLVSEAASIVADQSGFIIATVTTATPLAAAQLKRLQQSLSSKYGRQVKINLLTDPELIGGVRVSVGDDVIDGSIATRLSDLRMQLAG